MTARNRNLLIATATVIGGFSLVVFSKISRDIIFDGLIVCNSTTLDLSLGGLSFFTSSVLAGFMTSIIVMRANYWPHIFMSSVILAKIFLINSCGVEAQFILEMALNVILILGLWLGHYAALKFPLAPV